MTAYTAIVDADLCVGLIWYSLNASDLHLFSAPTLTLAAAAHVFAIDESRPFVVNTRETIA